jgi:hypothetical protein
MTHRSQFASGLADLASAVGSIGATFAIRLHMRLYGRCNGAGPAARHGAYPHA